MADDRLTNRQIKGLAASISVHNMQTIALDYMGLSKETVQLSEAANRGHSRAFNRDILQSWFSRNFGPDQVKVTMI